MPSKKAKSSYGSPSINSHQHNDKRPNIPTEELRSFVDDDEEKPKMIRYQRDLSLDPQLVWNGKDEQDSKDLEVPAVPIYIQEIIRPESIVKDFLEHQRQQSEEQQTDLFADHNDLPFSDKIDFYRHETDWKNRMILGDSLLVMNSLAEKERLKGRVQMIYLDPPYGIKFGSNWQASTRKRDVKDGKIEDVTRQPEQIRAFRDTWEKGIHSYLAYLRDRLVIARELLTETGSIFIQIGDENIHRVRCLMDEIFGNENFVSQIAYSTTGGFSTNTLSRVGDYLLWYAKNQNVLKYRQLYNQKASAIDDSKSKYDQLELLHGTRRVIKKKERDGATSLPIGSRIYRLDNMCGQGASDEDTPVSFEGQIYRPPTNNHWKANYPIGIRRLSLSNRIQITGKSLAYVRFFDDFEIQPINNIWLDIGGGVQSRADSKTYVVQTGTPVIERCLLMSTDPGDLVLDPTCGSGTTAYVAEQRGRRWITIDTSRVALALARTRLMTAKFPYYLLADSPEGRIKEQEITGISNIIPVSFGANQKAIAAEGKNQSKDPWETPTGAGVKSEHDIKKGFIYKRVPHVTLKAIANNPEIDTIHAKYQEQLEPIRTQLNKLLKQSWEEWQIPRNSEEKWSEEAKSLLSQWWELRQKRQKEIDESIARNADTEILYEQPYEDSKRVRVAGFFTVESLSPHRVLSTEEERPNSESAGQQQASDHFETRIIENLRKAGVQNTKKNERLKFDTLEPHPGTWIHAIGEYTDTDEKVKRVAISIGSEYGTVGSDDIREAAKEAVQGIGYDLLIVCGFAFEPTVPEEAKRYGRLTVLPTRMNSDLLLGDELLKKTSAANLFMVFGEPDIEIHKQDDGKITVELKGLDIYDPTTGEIRTSSTDDIACWFIDTQYDSERFVMRHVYFTGADQPYDKLKRALKAEVDESAWSDLYSTISRPFTPPSRNGKPGKIAVKVINHYGDEVLKVYEVK